MHEYFILRTTNLFLGVRNFFSAEFSLKSLFSFGSVAIFRIKLNTTAGTGFNCRNKMWDIERNSNRNTVRKFCKIIYETKSIQNVISYKSVEIQIPKVIWNILNMYIVQHMFSNQPRPTIAFISFIFNIELELELIYLIFMAIEQLLKSFIELTASLWL